MLLIYLNKKKSRGFAEGEDRVGEGSETDKLLYASFTRIGRSLGEGEGGAGEAAERCQWHIFINNP